MHHNGVTGIILAAGRGKRLKSNTPKVLHRAAGRSLLAHVLTAFDPLEASRCIVVASADSGRFDDVIKATGLATPATCVVQDPPRGTADAVRIAFDAVDGDKGTVIVLPGDHPLLETRTLRALIDVHNANSASATLLTAHVENPSGYGRVLRAPAGDVVRIVEEHDADEYQRSIHEVNAGVYVFDGDRLAEVLGKVDRENSQNEYYLTDAIEILASQGDTVVAHATDAVEVIGVNSRPQLARVSEVLRRRTCERWLDEGVTIVDVTTTFIDSSVTIARDATIHPFTFLEGETSIGEGAEIGPQVRIVDSEIADHATVSFAVVRGSIVGPDASVGPFASMRPGTRLERGARVGTFVETKETVLGEDSKANHLAYLGDAEIGRGVNVGAGSITCNWDGTEKHKTVIEDDAYIASDTMMVAPVRIGRRAATGAGAVVRDDVPDDALAVGVPARVIEGKGDKMKTRSRKKTETAD